MDEVASSSYSGERLVETLTRIEVKLDNSLTKIEDHESRLRAVERKLWIAMGAAGMVGGGVGQLVEVFMNK